MAIYHLSMKIISRGKGKSAVAAAAYRSGEKITNDYDGITHDYTRKGGVAHTEILLPEHAPPELANRTILWNAVERIEKSKNSQLSREIEIALPKELNREQQIELAREYCRKFFVLVGMCADICIHDKQDGNPHVHIMLTMRPFEREGSWAAKSKKEYVLDENGERIRIKSGEYKSRKVDVVDWNDQTKAEEWRQGWAELCNAYLAKNNVAERVDHRSYQRQGIEQIPTIHMGVAASQMERRGIATERGGMNRQVQLDNNMLRQLRARINKLKSGLDEMLAAENSPSISSHPIPSINLVDVLTGILKNPEDKTRRQKIADLKTVAKAIAFLQRHGISDLPGLQSKVTEMHERQKALPIRAAYPTCQWAGSIFYRKSPVQPLTGGIFAVSFRCRQWGTGLGILSRCRRSILHYTAKTALLVWWESNDLHTGTPLFLPDQLPDALANPNAKCEKAREMAALIGLPLRLTTSRGQCVAWRRAGQKMALTIQCCLYNLPMVTPIESVCRCRI